MEKIDNINSISGKEREKMLVENIESLPITDNEKKQLILVGLGFKPTSFNIYDQSRYGERGLDYELKLRSLGFGVSVRQRVTLNEGLYFLVFVGRSQELADKLKDAYYHPSGGERDEYKVGVLLGFPETAARAYADDMGRNKDLMIDQKDLPSDVRKSDFMAFAEYALSKAHWREELATAKAWANAIKEADLALYERIVFRHRKYFPVND